FELTVDTQLRGRGKIEQLLQLGHEVYLATPFEDVHSLLRGDHRVAIEVCRPLFELREVLHTLERTLRAEQTLDVHAPEAWCLDAPPEFLGADIANQVEGSVRVAVDVAFEARHAATRALGAPVLGLVELLLRERRDQQPQAL